MEAKMMLRMPVRTSTLSSTNVNVTSLLGSGAAQRKKLQSVGTLYCRVSYADEARHARIVTISCINSHGSKDAVVGSWIDLTGFVAASKGNNARTPYDALAEEIGRECYIDVCGWHLYLKDVKISSNGKSTNINMAQGLAQRLGPQIQGKRISSSEVNDLLDKVPVTLGQGKRVVSLSAAMPDRCVQDIFDICENYSRNF